MSNCDGNNPNELFDPVVELERILADKDSEIEMRRKTMFDQDNIINDLEAELDELRATLQNVKDGKGWYEDTPAGQRKHYSCSEEEELKQAAIEITELRATVEQWKTWGVIEIAVRNPNVASYIEHWEGRATTAEAENARLKAVSDEEAWTILGEPVTGRGDYAFMVAAKQFTNEILSSRSVPQEGQPASPYDALKTRCSKCETLLLDEQIIPMCAECASPEEKP